MNREERTKYGNEVSKINRRFETVFFPKVKKAIKTKVDELIAELKNSGIEAGKRYLNNQLTNKALSNIVNVLYQTVGLRHARRVNADLNRQKTIKAFYYPMEQKRIMSNPEWIRLIHEYLNQFLLEKITYDVSATTRNKLLSVLNESITEGLGVDEIVKRLEDLPFTEYQAARIVRTEIKRASEVGAAAASESFPFEQQKEWIAIKDTRTRGNPANGQKDHADHFDMDGMVVDADKPFIDPRNNREIRFPGDPQAGAADVINCRCTVGYVAKRDENGRMIPKQPNKLKPVNQAQLISVA